MTIQTDVLPQVGDIVAGGRFRICPGGKGANEAIAASRLGGSVSLITKTGNDGSSRKSGAWILRKVLNLWHENRRCNMDVPARGHGRAI